MRTSTDYFMNGSAEILLCPKCNFQYLHFHDIRREPNSIRGDYPDDLVIEYSCENGCVGELRFNELKGNIFVVDK